MDTAVSRRDLLKGAAIGTAAAAAANVTFVKPEDAKATEVDGARFEVYTADVIFVGGGASAAWTSQHLLAAGRQIMVVDKAPFRHSGTSGMSWESQFVWVKPASLLRTGMGDPNIWQAAYDCLGGDEYNPLVDLVNHGETIPSRLEDGSIIPNRGVYGSVGTFYRRDAEDMYMKSGVSVMDEVMVTDILVNEGRCLGVIGLHLPTGTLRVIRSNAVVLCCNSSMPWRGRHTVGHFGVSSADNTGDAQMALFRHGMGIAGSEFGNYDVFTTEPIDLAHCMGASICVDSTALNLIYDANHERLFADDAPQSNTVECETIVKAIYEEGRGTENNRVYCHFAENVNHTFYITHNINLLKQYGVDPVEGYVEIYPEMYEHQGNPMVNEQMMTEWTGLFAPRGANGMGCRWISIENKLFSNYTGKCMADWFETDEAICTTEVDWSQVVAEYNRLNALRTVDTEEGIRPCEIRKRIQDAGGRGFDYYRPTAWMEEAVAELQRIRTEDMPKQALTSDSTTYNMEWKLAIENVNLLDAAEMSIRASLLREESRECYRPEFPVEDNENWLCHLICHLDENGEMVFEKQAVPELRA